MQILFFRRVISLHITYVLAVTIVTGISAYIYFISIPTDKNIEKYWSSLKLDLKTFSFYLSKCQAYRRVFSFFTFVSYALKFLGVFSTAFLLHSALNNASFTNSILIISAVCDSVGILFPFQKYVDAFSYCCVIMEKAILESDQLTNDDDRFTKLNEAYIRAEEYLHIELKI